MPLVGFEKYGKPIKHKLCVSFYVHSYNPLEICPSISPPSQIGSVVRVSASLHIFAARCYV